MLKKINKKSTQEKHNAIYIPTDSFDDVIKCEKKGKILWPTLKGLTPKKDAEVFFALNGSERVINIGKVIKAQNKCKPFKYNKHNNGTWRNDGLATGMLVIDIHNEFRTFTKSELKENGVDIVKGRKQYITVPFINMWKKSK